jgi:hypothetical protein
MNLNESLNNVLDYKILTKNGWGDSTYEFSLKDIGLDLRVFVKINYVREDGVLIAFEAIGEDNELSNQKMASFTIFGTITEIVKTFVEENDITYVEAQADFKKKVFIYEKLFKRFGNHWSVERIDNIVYAKES